MSFMQLFQCHGLLARLLTRWGRESCAATAIEYGLIAGGISLAIVAAVYLMGDSLTTLFTSISASMADSAGKVANN